MVKSASISLMVLPLFTHNLRSQSPDMGGAKLGVTIEVDIAAIGQGYEKYQVKSQDGIFTVVYLRA